MLVLWIRHAAVTVALLLLAMLGVTSFIAYQAISMPGETFKGPIPPLNASEIVLASGLKQHIGMLASKIGERNMEHPRSLAKAADYIESTLKNFGYRVESQWYTVNGQRLRNLIVEQRGSTKPEEILVVGAHYDSVLNCPGANDNASGIASVLELARLFKGKQPARTLRFVCFVNEEDPYFGTEQMGSYQYALRCAQRNEKIRGMIAVETIGYHSSYPGSQKLPPLADMVYPNVGNFVWFVGNQQSKALVHSCIATFRALTPFPSEGVAAPEWIEGVDWCDQLYFWRNGYQGLMVTDSAPYRYPFYHTPRDTADKIDYPGTARIVGGLQGVIAKLVSDSEIVLSD